MLSVCFAPRRTSAQRRQAPIGHAVKRDGGHLGDELRGVAGRIRPDWLL
jgi:hypothetical protein